MVEIKRGQLTGVLVLLLVLLCSSPGWGEKVATTPAPTGCVDDDAELLSDPGRAEIEAICRQVHERTKAQIFVVTIHRLEGEAVEKFANVLFAKWKVGEKKTDRGVLLLFAMDDRKRWIEVGYGLEGALNDAKVGTSSGRWWLRCEGKITTVRLGLGVRDSVGDCNGYRVTLDSSAQSSGEG